MENTETLSVTLKKKYLIEGELAHSEVMRVGELALRHLSANVVMRERCSPLCPFPPVAGKRANPTPHHQQSLGEHALHLP